MLSLDRKFSRILVIYEKICIKNIDPDGGASHENWNWFVNESLETVTLVTFIIQWL